MANNIENVKAALDSVNSELKRLKSLNADDSNILLDLESEKIRILHKKFELLCELRFLLRISR